MTSSSKYGRREARMLVIRSLERAFGKSVCRMSSLSHQYYDIVPRCMNIIRNANPKYALISVIEAFLTSFEFIFIIYRSRCSYSAGSRSFFKYVLRIISSCSIYNLIMIVMSSKYLFPSPSFTNTVSNDTINLAG